MSLEYIFSKNYLFDPMPPAASRLTFYFLIFFLLLILASLYLKLLPEMLAKFYGKLFIPFLSTGLLGLIYLFARSQQLTWLGSRAFAVLDLLLLLAWTGIMIFQITPKMAKYRKEMEIEDRYKKYLPKSKSQIR